VINELPRQKLAKLARRFSLDLCNDPKRCEGLLRDVCGEHKREILPLVSALREGAAFVVLAFLAASAGT
jgi:hypothetical protein